MTDKHIKNENWYIKTLVSKVKTNEIYKPKYQRKRKWELFPNSKKENVPSEKKYIEFLYDTYNSVHAITFGVDKFKLSNIDGNNRINAIVNFVDKPLRLFPEKLYKLKEFITTNIDKNIADEIEQIMIKMSYEDLMLFKYNKYFIEKGLDNLYNTHLKKIRDELEPYFDELINSMKINNKDRFDNDVQINVNIFTGYTTEELAEVFGKINQYNSGLTEQEALASRLFNITNFDIKDKLLEYQIKVNIKNYYNERINGEILDCYKYNEYTDLMNAYDFMVGFQNYNNSKCCLIHKTDNDGLSLFFKIFKNLFKGSFDITFTTENVNDFIKLISKTTQLLTELEKTLFMPNFTGGGNKIFETANKKLKSLKKNNMYLIITSIIGYILDGTSDEKILKSIQLCILYHFFVNGLENKDKRDQYQLNDGILYEAGGAFIDNKAKDYLKNPSMISSKINISIMEELLHELISENIKPKQYEIRKNGKDKLDKRRSRKVFEKFLIYNYFNSNVPYQYLHNNFWIEHIFPFSSSWKGIIDIDRLGNIIPILEQLNKERSNKHISEYKKIDKYKFLNFIDNIPTENEYDVIISHENKKPHIYNIENYNEICRKNEQNLINCLTKFLF
jgi:hypothetical protein